MTAALPPLPAEDLAHARSVVGERWQQLKGQRVFLTGGTGFVGKWLVATLIEADRHFQLGCRLTVLTRNPAAFRAEAPALADRPCVELLPGDVRTLSIEGRAFDRILHAATDVATSASDLDTFDTCVEGTHRVLELARRCGAKNLLLVSSGAVYGPQPADVTALLEDHPGSAQTPQATPAYTMGKKAAEWMAFAHAREHGLDLRVARLFAFVGPGLPLDKHFAIGNFLRDALAGRPIVIQGDGTPLRSYLHTADLAAWLWTILLDDRARGGLYNVGGADAVSIRQLADCVLAATGSSSRVQVMQEALAGAAPSRYVPDIAKARRELALPEPIGLDESLRRTAAWLSGR
ncbi:MAG: NAD-dependent epimerase/dehydratase family protein [Rhizobacter sp.]|nr:NAD-dependent epimerase/dehydratase family protein [Rhizobacter sp.]